LKGQGLDYKNQGPICVDFIWWKDRLVISKKFRGSLEKTTGATLVDWCGWV
jgi:hypothetical protein